MPTNFAYFMRFTADLHIHTDHWNDRKRPIWHGDYPERIAAGIVESGVDVAAITEHYRPNERYFEVMDEVARLTGAPRTDGGIIDGCGGSPLIVLGTELTGTFDRVRYHVCYVYSGDFRPGQLPEPFPKGGRFEELEHYKGDYPGVAILAHPAWKDHHGQANGYERTEAFMASGLVDGVEILNGAMLANGADNRITVAALHMYRNVRKRGHRVAAIGSSDAHTGVGNPRRRNLVGSAVTEFSRATRRELFDAIRTQQTKARSIDEEVRRKVRLIVGGMDGSRLHKYMVIG